MADGSSARVVEIRIIAQGTVSQSGATNLKADQDADLQTGSGTGGTGGGGVSVPASPAGGGGGEGGGSAPNPASGGGSNVVIDASITTEDTTKALSKGWASFGVKTAKQVGSLILEEVLYGMNRNATLSGDYQMQNTVTNVSTIGNTVISGVTGIVASAMAGFEIGGPIGAVVAGAVTTLLTGTKIWRQTEHAKKNYDDEIRISEYTQNYNRVRAGYSLTDGTSWGDR